MIRSLIVALRRWPTSRRPTSRGPRQRMDRPHRTEDGGHSPAVIDGHRLELADACRAALEAFDRGAGHRTRA
jgi:hypothetical protein